MITNESSAVSRERPSQIVFATTASTQKEMKAAGLLIKSIRSFGGALRESPIWLLRDREAMETPQPVLDERAETLHMKIPDSIRGYELSDKVCACAEAERRIGGDGRTLTWLNPDAIIVSPPTQFLLDASCDVALRPVHIRNVGMSIDEPLDGFWRGVMEVVGLDDTDFEVESFVDRKKIRAYFNTHSYSVNPIVGLFREWLDCYERLVTDEEYQRSHCPDDLHRIFLHQAILSALTVARVKQDRIRILPQTYSYPYNLQPSIPPDRRAVTVNELVSLVYEERTLDPGEMNDIEVREPLRSWLTAGGEARHP